MNAARAIICLALIYCACSKPRVAPAAAAAPPMRSPQNEWAVVPSAARPVTWSTAVAGPKRSDLDQALAKPLEYPWHMFDRKTNERHEARTCGDLLALHESCYPMDVPGDGGAPTELFENDWSIYADYVVACRITVAIQNAKPARVDYLGAFPLDNARLREIPAGVIPTPSDEEEKQLKAASAKGVSWKAWDRHIHVTKTTGRGVTVESPDTYSFLSVYGRADFNGDGIEDLLLWRDGRGQEGTWNSTAGFVLTRLSARGRVEILKVIE